MALIKGNKLNNDLYGTQFGDTLFGYAGNDTLTGFSGADRLDGGQGADLLTGGKSNDTYVVNHIGDAIIELHAGGKDTVESSISWTLGDNLENLVLTGTKAINGSGNHLSNLITGNSANNILTGGACSDLLLGEAGNDSLDGETGRDTLNGGDGIDSLAGGLGNDSLILSDFNGDTVSGGRGIDSLLVSGQDQTLNLESDSISGVEVIKFNDNSNNTLSVTAQSVLALSPDSDTLRVDAQGNNTVKLEAGWVETGLVDGYKVFTKDGATLQIDADIDHIEMPSTVNAYTISDVASAANVGSAFTSGVDEIMIYFNGAKYSSVGLTSIDLSGFGLEDKLIINTDDGILGANGGSATPIQAVAFNTYISEISDYTYGTTRGGSSGNQNFSVVETYNNSGKRDFVFWDVGADHATLQSIQIYSFSSHGKFYTRGTKTYTNVTASGNTTRNYSQYTSTVSTFSSKYFSTISSGKIVIVGLPPDLPSAQFVFV